MVQQLLIPGVQDTEESDLCTQMFRVARDGEQSLRAGAEQKPVDLALVPQRERRELVGQSGDDVRIACGQQFPAARLKPAIACIGLALGAVPVAEGVVRDGLMTALRTLIDMAAQRGRPAASDRPQHTQLLVIQPRILLDEAIPLLAE
jgi:hypothetical protein